MVQARQTKLRPRPGGGIKGRREEKSVKKSTPEERQRMCTRKRRYRTAADALDAARLVGVERQRKAYVCPICRHWHLTTR